MRQADFSAQHAAEWDDFETWLDRRAEPRKARDRRAADRGESPAMPDAEMPRRYRMLCQQLALARDRQYSPDLVDRLNRIALRGHHVLYGARPARGNRVIEFLFGAFPRAVRADWRLVIAAVILFFGPIAALIAVLQWYPDFIHYLMSPRQVAGLEEMYNPANTRYGMRAADTNVQMFAYYIWNNVKIGFQTFATGLVFGLGSIFFLVFNGIHIGAAAGYLTKIGSGTPFWSFVAGHSAMELVAIAISGAAGLKLGIALIAPGRLSRKAALVAAARDAMTLVYGAAAMFFAAAIIEAFWSPHTLFPPVTKYAIGLILWATLLGYFLLAGRGEHADRRGH